MDEACCTCATLFSTVLPSYDEKSEKPLHQHRPLECCGRLICGKCLVVRPSELFWQNILNSLYRKTRDSHHIVRFSRVVYVSWTDRGEGPFCQVSTSPNPLPQGLRDPPAYSESDNSSPDPLPGDVLPAYSIDDYQRNITGKIAAHAESHPGDVLHFVDPSHDSILSLSLRYGVPSQALRRVNGLYADHLLAARRTILIPGEFYKGGVSLSPTPVDGEEEDIRKVKIRRWMVACKVAEWVAPLKNSLKLGTTCVVLSN